MYFLKELRKKTWIDWLKILVAIDMTFVGIGLVLNIHFHVLADSLGFLTRIPFGILYVFVAFIIFKRVFPARENKPDEEVQGEKENKELQEEADTLDEQKENIFTLAWRYISAFVEKLLDAIDDVIDALEEFLKKRFAELQDEIRDLSKK